MAARSGMVYLIAQVRQLANAGDGDYTIAGFPYWSDDQIQDILDQCREDIYEEAIHPVAQRNSGGTVEYREYRSAHAWFEQTAGGTAVWYLQAVDGAFVGTADYTVDYRTGRIVFAADQAGSARYLTGRAYDVYEAAAQVWDEKAAHVADRYDFSADGASFKASQMMSQYQKQAMRLRSQSTTGGVRTHRWIRSDANHG